MTTTLVERQESAPVVQARIDWALVGEFNACQFTGEDREAYLREAENIQRQWDNQGE